MTAPTFEAVCDSCGTTGPSDGVSAPDGWAENVRTPGNLPLLICPTCQGLPLATILGNSEEQLAKQLPPVPEPPVEPAPGPL